MSSVSVPTGGLIGVMAFGSGVGLLGLILSLVLTNPAAIGPLGVTVWFMAMLLTVAGVIGLGLYFVKWRLWPEQPGRKRLGSSSRQGLLVSGWGTVLLALSSLQQFSWRDAVLLAVLIGLVELYARART